VASIVCLLGAALLAEAIEDNIYAGAGERFRDAEPDPTCRTSYNGGLALKFLSARGTAINRAHDRFAVFNGQQLERLLRGHINLEVPQHFSPLHHKARLDQ
jgi:hypothetical protein